MARHSKKPIREAIEYAVSKGWTVKKAAARAHIWGKLYCPERNRGGHLIFVYSTPASAENHGAGIRKQVDACEHS